MNSDDYLNRWCLLPRTDKSVPLHLAAFDLSQKPDKMYDAYSIVNSCNKKWYIPECILKDEHNKNLNFKHKIET